MVRRMLSRTSDHLSGPRPSGRAPTRELMEQTNIYELMEELRRIYR